MSRYNISRNDRARIFHLSGATRPPIDDNAVYVGDGLDVQMMLVTDWSGWSTGAMLRNNRFYVDGDGALRARSQAAGGRHVHDGAGLGRREGHRVRGQSLRRQARGCPEGAACARQDRRPAIDWSGPEFDPAKPDEFDAFLKQTSRMDGVDVRAPIWHGRQARSLR